jgi:hypothetical protein
MKRFLLLLTSGIPLLSACSPGLLPLKETAIQGTFPPSTPIVGTAVPDTITGVPPEGSQPPAEPLEPPTAIPTLPGGLPPTELKYLLLERYPDMFYCDPDFYPVARGDELDRALAAFPALQENAEEFQAILRHSGLAGLTTLTSEQVLKVYQEHKRLAAIDFQLTEDGYQFQLQVSEGEGQGMVVNGLIDGTGSLTILSSQPTSLACPICLAAGTLIDTPRGPVLVEKLSPGDLVWTASASGERAAVELLKTSRMAAPYGHQVAHLVLADGRELWVSPGHPVPDGRRIGDLKVGEPLDGSQVAQLDLLPYGGSAVFDILPAGTTGWYWADGILLASTLEGD